MFVKENPCYSNKTLLFGEIVRFEIKFWRGSMGESTHRWKLPYLDEESSKNLMKNPWFLQAQASILLFFLGLCKSDLVWVFNDLKYLIYLFKNNITYTHLKLDLKIKLQNYPFFSHVDCLKRTKAKSKRGFTGSGLLHMSWSLTWTWCLWLLNLRHCTRGSPRAVEASTSRGP